MDRYNPFNQDANHGIEPVLRQEFDRLGITLTQIVRNSNWTGAFGVVFGGLMGPQKVPVAIKVFRDYSADLGDRFGDTVINRLNVDLRTGGGTKRDHMRREFKQTFERMQACPNAQAFFPILYHVGEVEGVPYAVMQDLTQSHVSITHGGVAMERSRVKAFGRFLRDLHTTFGAHADLKPNHIFVGPDGHFKVIDPLTDMAFYSEKSGPVRPGEMRDLIILATYLCDAYGLSGDLRYTGDAVTPNAPLCADFREHRIFQEVIVENLDALQVLSQQDRTWLLHVLTTYKSCLMEMFQAQGQTARRAEIAALLEVFANTP